MVRALNQMKIAIIVQTKFFCFSRVNKDVIGALTSGGPSSDNGNGESNQTGEVVEPDQV